MKKPRFFISGRIPMISEPSLEIKRKKFKQEIHKDVFDRLELTDLFEIWMIDWEGIKVVHFLKTSTRKVTIDQDKDFIITLSLTKEQENSWVDDLKEEIEGIKEEREEAATDTAKG